MFGSILSGIGGSLLGGIFDSAIGASSARRQERFVREEAQKARDFSERMSSTAHQRQVTDMRRAGLNPILSATGGSGAAAPSGAMASTPESISTGISNASSARAARETIQNIKETNENLREERERIKADTQYTRERARRESADADRAQVRRLPYTGAKRLVEGITSSAKAARSRFQSTTGHKLLSGETVRRAKQQIPEWFGLRIRGNRND